MKAKSKRSTVLLRELLFADDAALASQSEADLQRLIDRFAFACNEFGLTISLQKTKVMTQDASEVPSINIGNYTLEVVEEFTYLGSTISANLSLDREIDRRIGHAAATMAKLSKRVWQNRMITENTKVRVYQACILSTLLYGSESWTTYMRQERRLHAFHMRCLKRILGITWQDKIPHSTILIRAKISSIFSLLSQRRLRWLGHVYRMDDERIPKKVLYSQLATGSRRLGRPVLRYKDVCKRDIKSCDIDLESWERTVTNRSKWREVVRRGTESAEKKRDAIAAKKRALRHRIGATSTSASQNSGLKCDTCGRVCLSRIGLFSHARRCHSSQARRIVPRD